jgi:hypothetical protein
MEISVARSTLNFTVKLAGDSAMRGWDSLDDVYPEAEIGFRSETGFFKSDASHQCSDCGVATMWFHMGIMLYFCSERCYRTFKRRPHRSD